MSKLKSASRKLSPQRVWIANQKSKKQRIDNAAIKDQVEEAKIVIPGELHDERLARVMAVGLASEIDNTVLEDIVEEHVVNPISKSTLSGTEISREQAMEGLGDPTTWAAEREALLKDFQTKPDECCGSNCGCHSS